MSNPALIPHLFRTEYRKIVAVLTKLFGFAQLETAQDIVSDTFLIAAETWGQKGIPDNPTAWLYRVAKNKAIDHLRRQQSFRQKVSKSVQEGSSITDDPLIDLSPQHITDSQLQMMFAICNPILNQESQVGLALQVLCGFGVDEIADAFLTNKETIYKRLIRAKEKLRQENITIALPSEQDIPRRLETVLATLYLLFSEGYYSSSQNVKLRKDLCLEAIRLNVMLTENAITNQPMTNALLALMCFHASRFEARINQAGELVLYEDQVEAHWNQELIQKGEYFLNKASTGTLVSKYHIEAAIAYWHTHKKDTPEKWESILQLYNRLLLIDYSPIAALNRTFALAKANGREEAIKEAEKLQLIDHQLYYMLLTNLYEGIDLAKAKDNLLKAKALSKSESDKKLIETWWNKLNKD